MKVFFFGDFPFYIWGGRKGNLQKWQKFPPLISKYILNYNIQIQKSYFTTWKSMTEIPADQQISWHTHLERGDLDLLLRALRALCSSFSCRCLLNRVRGSSMALPDKTLGQSVLHSLTDNESWP